MDQKTEPNEDETRDTEPPTPLCGKKRRAAGNILHCDKELDHQGPCSFEEDFEP